MTLSKQKERKENMNDISKTEFMSKYCQAHNIDLPFLELDSMQDIKNWIIQASKIMSMNLSDVIVKLCLQHFDDEKEELVKCKFTLPQIIMSFSTCKIEKIITNISDDGNEYEQYGYTVYSLYCDTNDYIVLDRYLDYVSKNDDRDENGEHIHSY